MLRICFIVMANGCNLALLLSLNIIVYFPAKSHNNKITNTYEGETAAKRKR